MTDFPSPTTALQAAHDELLRLYHQTGDAGDWQERAVLGSLVDIADQTKRIADNTHSAHDRAGDAGVVLHASARLQRDTILACAGWPDDHSDLARAIADAATILDTVSKEIVTVMWALADARALDVDQTHDLAQAVNRFRWWAQRYTRSPARGT